jgi:hypothetical protein
MLRLIFCLCFLPGLALAEEIMSPEDFQSYAEGKTLYFSQQGQPYGVEQYLPGQQSIWQYADGTCAYGIWYARKNFICFIYDGDGDAQCWHFLQKGEQFSARAAGREPDADLDVIWKDERPISCKGPGVGV